MKYVKHADFEKSIMNIASDLRDEGKAEEAKKLEEIFNEMSKDIEYLIRLLLGDILFIEEKYK